METSIFVCTFVKTFNSMKTNRIDLRTSDEDEKILQRAASKMGEKNVSKVILNSVKEYAEAEPEMFFCNRPAIRDVDANISKGKTLLQAIIDQFLKINVPVTLDEIRGWYGTSRMNFMIPNQEAIR